MPADCLAASVAQSPTHSIAVLLDAGAIRVGGRGFPKVNWNRLQIPMVITSAVIRKKQFERFYQNPWYLGRLAETARKVPLKKLVDFQIAFAKPLKQLLND